MDAPKPSHTRSFIALSRLAATIGAFVLVCATPAHAQEETTMIAIEKMDVGHAPPNFEFARTGQGGPGTWTVVTDPSAGGGRAIAQTSTDRTDYRFPLAIHNGITAKNVDVSVRFKPVDGKVDRAGGIAVRLLDADNYYVVRANALEDNVRSYRVVKGRREQLAGADTKVSANEWHTIGLKADGYRFTITFDGRELYTANDKTFADAGKVALWTKADSVTRFDQMQLNMLPDK